MNWISEGFNRQLIDKGMIPDKKQPFTRCAYVSLFKSNNAMQSHFWKPEVCNNAGDLIAIK